MRIGSGLFHAAQKAEREGLSSETIAILVEQAGSDISELRALLDSWRDTKRTARHALIRWIIRLLLSALMLGLAVKFKLIQLGQLFGN